MLLSSPSVFFGTFSIGLEGGIVNALHKAHNNKETQLGRRENGMEVVVVGGVKGQSRELRILLVESHGHHRIDSLSMRAADKCFPHGRPQLSTTSSLDRKEISPAAVM